MPITLRDFLTFPFNSGKGIRTDQLDGEFVKAVQNEGETLILMVQRADGTETAMRFTGVTPVDLFTRRVGTSPNTVLTAADVLQGTSSQNESVTVPLQGTGANQQYVGIWIPADRHEVTFISLAATPTINRRYDFFNAPVVLQVSGDDGYLYRSSRQFALSTLGGTTMTVRHESGQPVYLRRCAFKEADEDFTAADFTGASGSTSTDKFIVTPSITNNSYLAFAVLDSTNDPTSIVQGDANFGVDYLDQMTRQAGTLTIEGADYKVWVSDQQYNAFLSGLKFRIEQ